MCSQFFTRNLYKKVCIISRQIYKHKHKKKKKHCPTASPKKTSLSSVRRQHFCSKNLIHNTKYIKWYNPSVKPQLNTINMNLFYTIILQLMLYFKYNYLQS